MYEIEKDIPVRRKDQPQHRKWGKSKYPFEEMVEGDSFFIPDVGHFALGDYNRKYAKEGMKFISRICAKGVRVWLVKKEPWTTVEIEKDIPVWESLRGWYTKENTNE